MAQELRRRIAGGMYPSHSYLPAERTLAEELGTSRTTVSGALAELAGDRLVIQTRGRGTRVLPPQDRLSACLIGIVYNVLTPPNMVSPEGQQMLAGIHNTLSRLGYQYEHAGLGENLKLKDVRLERYGAVLTIEVSRWDTEILDLERQKKPVVVANQEEDAGVDLTATWVDHGKATFNAVRMLAALGHRRIALLTRDISRYFYARALQGYRQGLDAVGLTYDESLLAVCEYTPLSSYIRSKSLLAGANAPTAVVAARDVLAEGLCHAAGEAGLVVGRDVSVIGFDDLTWPRDEPFLTTFREPAYELGAVAAEMLVDRIVNGWRPPERREIEAPLILRRSVGPGPAGSGPRPAAAKPTTVRFLD